MRKRQAGMIPAFTVFGFLFFIFGCTRFNLPLIPADRLLVASSAGNFVNVYRINSTSGGLSLESSLSITSPTRVAAHPTSGAFLIHKNLATIECYQYQLRLGASPIWVSSTAVTNIGAMTISPDGNSVIYARTGSAFLYWRSISDCTLGTENQVAAAGLTNPFRISMPSDSSVVVLTDSATNGMWRYSRNSSTGILTFTNLTASGPSNGIADITPDGRFVLGNYTLGGVASFDSTTLAVVDGPGGVAVHALAILSNTRAIHLRTAMTHRGVTMTSSGTVSTGSAVSLHTGNFNGGFAMSPSRNLYFVGDQATPSVQSYVVTDTNPFSGTPSSIGVTSAPDSLSYLPGGWASI